MDFVCPYKCPYRTNSGYCGSTGGWERCQYRQLHQPNTVVGYVPPFKKTNADLIRAMTDEELAKWLWFKVEKCPPFDTCPSPFTPCEVKDCWLNWLKQEADT